MSFSSEIVVKGEAIESDDDSDDGIAPAQMINSIPEVKMDIKYENMSFNLTIATMM